MYDSVDDMPSLAPDDRTLSDSRWLALATMMDNAWFERKCVIQEVGLAFDPRVLYGSVEFAYRDLMKLGTWIEKCARHLSARAGLEFYNIHTEWLNWSKQWSEEADFHQHNFIDLFEISMALHCGDPRDRIFALLGHPAERSDGEGTIVRPDYWKAFGRYIMSLR